MAVDCYRDALANAKTWRSTPSRGGRPRVRKLSIPLHQGSGYRIKDGYLGLAGGIRLRTLGWDRRYDSFKILRVEKLGSFIKMVG